MCLPLGSSYFTRDRHLLNKLIKKNAGYQSVQRPSGIGEGSTGELKGLRKGFSLLTMKLSGSYNTLQSLSYSDVFMTPKLVLFNMDCNSYG